MYFANTDFTWFFIATYKDLIVKNKSEKFQILLN